MSCLVFADGCLLDDGVQHLMSNLVLEIHNTLLSECPITRNISDVNELVS